MPRKGENIYKRKDGRWEGRYIKDRAPDGKALYGYVYARSYREVKAKMNHSPIMVSVPVPVIPNADISGRISLQVIADDWFAAIQPQVKESTSVKYRNLLNTYILPELGKMMLCDMTHDRIEAYCNSLLLSGGDKRNGLSPKTVSDVLALLRNLLRFAARTGKMPPCDGSSVQIKNTQKELRIFSRMEQERLCRKLCSDLNAPNVGILVCLFTGLRIGEICALRWEDISLSERTIHVHQTMQRIQTNCTAGPKTKIIVTTPKSPCSIRTIPLPDDIADVIIEFHQSGTGYFLTGCDDKVIEPRMMQYHFKRILKECSIDNANYHVLRHTFATRCVELGFDVKTLSEILGHANVNITMNRYVHPSMELKRQNMQRLSSLIAVR